MAWAGRGGGVVSGVWHSEGVTVGWCRCVRRVGCDDTTRLSPTTSLGFRVSEGKAVCV